MIAIISLLVVITVSLMVTRIATIALTHTGLSRESARFQARSAFTGVGFTTTEAEKVVSHPVRRRIVMMLMLLGNAGIVTAVSSLMLSFVNRDGGSGRLWLKLVLLFSGLIVLWLAARSQWLDRRLCRLMDWALRRYTHLDVRDYASLMHLAGEYQIVELRVRAQDWLAHKTLRQTRLRAEGILVLGLQRNDGTYLGAPTPDTEILPDDTLLLYGRIATVAKLDQRQKDAAGDWEHQQAVAEEQALRREESEHDPARLPTGNKPQSS